MLEATHRKIAKDIAKVLKLNERKANLLEIGSVNPDSWADFPHHFGKEDEISEAILKARRLFLEIDDECFSTLGNALHYIADRWTLRPRLGDKHTQWENAISFAQILDDQQLEEEIKKPCMPTKAEQAYLVFLDVLRGGVFHPSIPGEKIVKCDYDRRGTCAGCMQTVQCILSAEKRVLRSLRHEFDPFKSARGLGVKVINYALQARPTTWSSPILDLNLAYRICLEVTRNVFSKEHDKKDWLEETPYEFSLSRGLR